MTHLKTRDVRKMSQIEREKRLIDLRKELMIMQSTAASGGVVENPAKIKNIRRSIARILTITREEGQ